MFATIKNYFAHLLEVPEAVSPARYRSLRRLMTVLMVAVSVTPLLLLSAMALAGDSYNPFLYFQF